MLRPEPTPDAPSIEIRTAGPVELARDARSGDAHHAAMPALAPLDDDRRQLAALDHAASRLLDHGQLLGLSLAVALVELGGERRRALRVAREQQLERLVGAAQPARGVESRPEPVADVGGAERRHHAGDADQRAQPLGPGLSQRLEAERGDGAVLADQGRHVGDGAEAGDAQQSIERGGTIAADGDRLRQLERESGAGEIAERIRAGRLVRIDLHGLRREPGATTGDDR